MDIQPDKTLPYNKACIHDKDDEDEITEDDEEHNSLPHDEKGKQELGMSVQISSKNSSHSLTEKQKKEQQPHC